MLMWSALLHQMGSLTCMLATITSSPFAEVCNVPHASSWFASGAIHVWCAMHAFAQVRFLVGRWWRMLQMMSVKGGRTIVQTNWPHHTSQAMGVVWLGCGRSW